MTKTDLRKLEWVKIADWSLLEVQTGREGPYVDKENINRFLTGVMKDIARKVDIPYKEVKEVITKENEAVYEYVYEIFSTFVYRPNANEIKQIQETFLIPKVQYSVENIVKMYNLLSDEEKKNFKKQIS